MCQLFSLLITIVADIFLSRLLMERRNLLIIAFSCNAKESFEKKSWVQNPIWINPKIGLTVPHENSPVFELFC